MSSMLRVAEKLRYLDSRQPGCDQYALARDYTLLLVEAIANGDTLLELEVSKSLGDFYMSEGTNSKNEATLTKAITMYMSALKQSIANGEPAMLETLIHRLGCAGKLKQKTSFAKLKSPVSPDIHSSAARLAETFQTFDEECTDGSKVSEFAIMGYSDLVVEGILNKDTLLEVEALKSLGNVCLQKGRDMFEPEELKKAKNLYHAALARLHGSNFAHHGMDALRHRLMFTAKVRQNLREQQQRFPTYCMPKRGNKVSRVECISSYDDYYLMGDRALKEGHLDIAEEHFASALKLVHDSQEPQSHEEADCLHKIGDISTEKGKLTKEGRNFTQAAALYNAAMARRTEEGFQKCMIDKIKEAEKLFLLHAVGLQCDPSPYGIDLDHKRQLKEIRSQVQAQLEHIHETYNPYKYEEDSQEAREVEVQRASAIKDLFKTIATNRREFLQGLVEECIAKVGPPPCKYAFIGLGSQATELVTPYSDLEFAILIEDGQDIKDNRRYFTNITHYLHLKVINLGETILPAMAILSLNDFLSEDPSKDWFYDSVTPRGFAFDGSMPWASKTPFGRDETKRKPSLSLIQTPANMATYQDVEVSLSEGYHLSSILRHVCLLVGQQSLVDDYMERMNSKLKLLLHHNISAARALIDSPDDILKFVSMNLSDRLLDVKKEIYRFPSIAVDILDIVSGVNVASVWSVVEELCRRDFIVPEDRDHLNVLISISAELRLRTYLANGGQKESLSPLFPLPDRQDMPVSANQTVCYLPDPKMLFRYYYSAIPLKRCILEIVSNLDKVTSRGVLIRASILDHSPKCRATMHEALFQLPLATQLLETALENSSTDEKESVEILQQLGDVWSKRGVERKAIDYYGQALKMQKASCEKDATTQMDISSLFTRLGAAWSKLGDARKAIMYLEMAIETKRSINNDIPMLELAGSHHLLGTSWGNFGHHIKAIVHFKQSLKIMKTVYGEDAAHPDTALLLNNMGLIWKVIGDERKSISCYEQSLTMMKRLYGNATAHPHIAAALCNIGQMWSELSNEKTAMSYFDQSLRMARAIYGDTAIHPQILDKLNSLGLSYRRLGNDKKALSCFKETLRMGRGVYGKNSTHPDIARALSELGTSLSNLGDHRKALAYFESSLEMMRDIYGHNNIHDDIASILDNIGSCWGKHGDQEKSLIYLEQALQMRRAIHGEGMAHPTIARSLANLGSCWTQLENDEKAIGYFEQSLAMANAIHGKDVTRLDIAKTLSNLGVCWSNKGQQRRAINYFEESLQMLKTIYGEDTVHPAISVSLSCLGSSWNELGEEEKALSFFEQALQMRQDLYGKNRPHPDIALSLNALGEFWNNKGDQKKAISCFEQEMKILVHIHRKHTAHPKIAQCLDNLGSAWSSLGNDREAINYYEQALRMMKTVYGHGTAHFDIAVTLDNLGSSWCKLSNERKAVDYFEQSLDMLKAMYGENMAHPDVASMLNKVGSTWHSLNNEWKAIQCFEQSLQMRKAIYGEDTAHYDIAESLKNLSICWQEVGDLRKAASYLEELHKTK